MFIIPIAGVSITLDFSGWACDIRLGGSEKRYSHRPLW